MIFDGHNDVLSKLYGKGGGAAAAEFVTGYDGAIDVPSAKSGGFAGGFFAVYVPSPGTLDTTGNPPLPDPISWGDAMPVVMSQAAILFDLEARGALKVCRTVQDIRAAMAAGIMAAVFHIEGAEAIDADLHTLEVLYKAGLRSLGPVWSRNTIFGHGVPFHFDSTPDIGPGLTDLGKRLVQRCNTLGIMIDLSHLNAAGFWDVAELSEKPLVATHSNVHAICPHARNLTDDQLGAIRESDGMVGLNFAVEFLRPDGRDESDVSFDLLLRHLDHLINHLGEDRVGFGSDYDGALVPARIKRADGLPTLCAALHEHGYDDALVAKLCVGNWMRVLEATWGA